MNSIQFLYYNCLSYAICATIEITEAYIAFSLSRNKITVLWKINLEDSSLSLKCVRGPNFDIFLEMFSTNLKSLVLSRHVGVLLGTPL